MTTNDLPALSNLLQEVCAIFDRAFSDVLVSGYYLALKPYSLEAINKAVLRVLTDEVRRQVMPTTAEIKSIAKHMAERGEEQLYLECQGLGCQSLVSWPPEGKMLEGSYFCPRHKPVIQTDWTPDKQAIDSATDDELHDLFKAAPPGAKAFLRSAVKGIFLRLLADIPITAEERAVAERMDAPRRAMAFQDKAEGPGVMPKVFLNHPNLLGDLPSDYRHRREIVASSGWRYEPLQGSWTRGRRRLSDDQIDGISDLSVLEELVSRR